MVSEEKPLEDMLLMIKEFIGNENITEQEIISIIWSATMSSQEWSKKEVSAVDLKM